MKQVIIFLSVFFVACSENWEAVEYNLTNIYTIDGKLYIRGVSTKDIKDTFTQGFQIDLKTSLATTYPENSDCRIQLTQFLLMNIRNKNYHKDTFYIVIQKKSSNGRFDYPKIWYFKFDRRYKQVINLFRSEYKECGYVYYLTSL